MGEQSSKDGGGEEADLGFEWDNVEDLTSLSMEELRDLLGQLDAREKDLSYRRRVLQGRIDVIRAEIVRRGGATLSPEELARVLMGSDPDPEASTEDHT